jgi:hypothetical protein
VKAGEPMSLSTFFLRKRIPNPTQGNTQFVEGITFSPGAEGWGTESTVGDPRYTLRVFPQWNFEPMLVYQTPMVFQALSLPVEPPAGFPFGGVRREGLINEADYPDVQGDYYS